MHPVQISASLRTLLTRAVAICPTLLVALSARSDSTKARAAAGCRAWRLPRRCLPRPKALAAGCSHIQLPHAC